MLILPVFAPAGTVAVIFVSETTLKPALTPPILTAVVPRRFVPVIVPFAPAFAFAVADEPGVVDRHVPARAVGVVLREAGLRRERGDRDAERGPCEEQCRGHDDCGARCSTVRTCAHEATSFRFPRAVRQRPRPEN